MVLAAWWLSIMAFHQAETQRPAVTNRRGPQAGDNFSALEDPAPNLTVHQEMHVHLGKQSRRAGSASLDGASLGGACQSVHRIRHRG